MLRQIAHEIDRMGGRAFLVGGSVRDAVMGIEPKDFDVEVFGLSPEALVDLLQRFGKVDTVGVSFGIIKLWAAGQDFDFSTPRRESKAGRGHRGFLVALDESLTPEEAAERRDFTWNALMQDVITGEVFDFFGGVADIEARVIRATSEHFSEDPLRVLRGMQFAARFEMTVEPHTASECNAMFDEFEALAVERVWTEFEKWAVKGVAPSFGLQFLEETTWVSHFPEIADLLGLAQDRGWHPEGDAFEHTCQSVDIAAQIATREELSAEDRMVLVFAALCHDFGKAETTSFDEDGHIRSRAHDEAGVAPTRSFMARIGAPEWLVERVVPLVREHMVHVHTRRPTPRSVRRLSVRLGVATVQELAWVMECDHSARGPLGRGVPRVVGRMLELAEQERCREAPVAQLLMGRHLIQMGLRPGPRFGEILRAAFQAQLEGEFETVFEAMEWAREFIAP